MLSVVLCCETDVNEIAVISLKITVKMKEVDLSNGGHDCGMLEYLDGICDCQCKLNNRMCILYDKSVLT
jgi:hypothetical protein